MRRYSLKKIKQIQPDQIRTPETGFFKIYSIIYYATILRVVSKAILINYQRTSQHALWDNFFYSYGNEQWRQKGEVVWGCRSSLGRLLATEVLLALLSLIEPQLKPQNSKCCPSKMYRSLRLLFFQWVFLKISVFFKKSNILLSELHRIIKQYYITYKSSYQTWCEFICIKVSID